MVMLFVVGVVPRMLMLSVVVVAVALRTVSFSFTFLRLGCHFLHFTVFAGPAAVLQVTFVTDLLADVAGVIVLNVGHARKKRCAARSVCLYVWPHKIFRVVLTTKK